MFTLDQVNKVIDDLKTIEGCFVSEAHMQLQFAIYAHKLFGNEYEFIPEYPSTTKISDIDHKTEFDLLIYDKNTKEKTLVEFKYKTKNESKKFKKILFPVYLGDDLSLAYDSAHNLNRYDCWWDIYRIENNVLDTSKNITNGFFIFVTNEDLYKEQDGSSTFSINGNGEMFSIKEGLHKAMNKKINPNVSDKSAGVKRKTNSIIIKNNYQFIYYEFKKFTTLKKYNTFWSLVVPINRM